MGRYIYIDGNYYPYAKARIHAEDRGLLFGDAIYEVCQVYQGHLIDRKRHMERLQRSMDEIKLTAPMSLLSLQHIMGETRRRNRVVNGLVYLQITRGQARRDFIFPKTGTPASVLCLARSSAIPKESEIAKKAISVVTLPDIRWQRVDIKSTALLANVLAREEARQKGAQEAWLVDEKGFVTEGAASNAWIINAENCLITHPVGQAILSGVTRAVVSDLVRAHGWQLIECPFTVAEAKGSKEAFITAATAMVTPVVKIDGCEIGTGQPGPMTEQLRHSFFSKIKK